MLLFLSCKDDDPTINPPILSYAESAIEVDFNNKGSIMPNIFNWEGETGTIQLMNSVSGVDIDQNTGELSWDINLPLGESEIDIMVSNSAGNATFNITINHLFHGTFAGTIDNRNADPIAMKINKDGTLKSALSFAILTGNWALDYNVSRLTANASGSIIGTETIKFEIDSEVIYKESDLKTDGESIPFIIGWFWFTSDPKVKTIFKAALNDSVIFE